jgi:two-component system, OmpR family, sensor histidine kinase TctE
VLVAMLGWWLGRSITEEVEPLRALQRAVDRRDSTDLAPLDTNAPSREVTALARALNALMRRVDEGVAAQREFAGNVAHELRTPLAGIRALAAYGLAHDDPAVWRRQLEAVVQSEERASRLVDQLLALALADEARDGLPLGPVALDEVVHATVLRCWPRAQELGVELGASGLDAPLRVHGHVALIEGAVDNLVHNALRHGRPPDGRPATLSVDVAREGNEVRVAVTDNGPGIAPAQRELLLRRWAQGGRRALQPGEGAGLGLAIVARYAALMGGSLALEDNPEGSGLAAVLRLKTA